MIKQRSINPRDITILNTYAPSNRALKQNKTKQKLIKLQGETVKSTIIIGNFSALISIIDRTSKQKVSKDILVDQNDTINEFDLIDIYRTLYPTTAEHSYTLWTYDTFLVNIDYVFWALKEGPIL